MRLYITPHVSIVMPDDKPTYTLYRYVGYLKKPVLTDSTIVEINDYLSALPRDDKTHV